MDTNNDDLIKSNLDLGQADVDQADQQKYQKILDEYSQQIASVEKKQDLSQHKLPPQKTDLVSPPSLSPVLPSKPTISTAVKPEQVIPKADIIAQPKPNKEPTRPVASSPKISPPQTKHHPDLFKYLFYFSVIAFLVLLALLSKDYLALRNANKNLPSLATPSPTTDIDPQTSHSPSVPNDCTLNENSYQIGDTIPSSDCNTCSCQDTDTGTQIVCTNIDCSLEK